jgi:putative transposase
MRSAHYSVPKDNRVAYYHCTSRVVDGRSIFGDSEKSSFITLMRQYEQLCGLQILTYCLMSNHFQLLIALPERPPTENLPTEVQLLDLIESVFDKARADTLRTDWAKWRALDSGSEGELRVQQAINDWFDRMWDLSAFMSMLKLRFSKWYNWKNDRKGTLWEARFKSMLVHDGKTLATLAAYMDLEPVRAGLAKDPKDYFWSGYGAACGGVAKAKAGLAEIMRLSTINSGFAHEQGKSPTR